MQTYAIFLKKGQMFHKIFVEEDIQHQKRTRSIIKHYPKADVQVIDLLENYFGRVKKPYLQKRDSLNLYVAQKRGALIKKAPDAYGLGSNHHWTFFNAYNCIYECNYCYLQGYFHSPDIVLFINYNDMLKEAEKMIKSTQGRLHFHSGEYADSLALSHLTDELETYFHFFSRTSNATLELRTKSVNIRKLLQLPPLPNVIASFSLSPEDKIKRNDRGTPPLQHRLKAMEKVRDHGHPLAIHFDPIIYDHNIFAKYEELILSLANLFDFKTISHFSLGIVRFTKDVYFQVKKHYPESEFFSSLLTSDRKNFIRYPKMMRLSILKKIRQTLLSHGASEESLYLCME